MAQNIMKTNKAIKSLRTNICFSIKKKNNIFEKLTIFALKTELQSLQRNCLININLSTIEKVEEITQSIIAQILSRDSMFSGFTIQFRSCPASS